MQLFRAMAARAEGPILELAVGSGRIAVPLAADGHAVTGVDRDPHMLARAERAWATARGRAGGGSARSGRRRGTLELVEADITDVSLGRRYALVILALNSLLMLPGREAQLGALRAMASHLEPAGRAVVDVWLPGPEDLALYDGRLTLDWLRDDPETAERVAKQTAARYDPATARAVVTSLFDAWPEAGGAPRRVAREDELHFLGAAELTALAGQAGLAIETIAGDHGMAEFGPGSERVVLVCGLL